MNAPYAMQHPPAPVAVRPTWRSPSTWLLIAANLVPLAGVLFFDWAIGELFLLYWFESAIVGGYNVLKMLLIGGARALPPCLFFTIHYGLFMAGHLVFIAAFFLGGGAPLEALPAMLPRLWPALLALVVSHGFAFWDGFLRPGEYRRRRLNAQMGEPYARIIVMHLTIIFGGFLAQALGTPLVALVLLIALKIAADLRAHLRAPRMAS